MKGAFETFLIFLLGMTFVLLGFSMVEITLKYNNARLYQETITSLIERHNRYDDEVSDLIQSSTQYCKSCTYDVNVIDDRYLVTVNFDIFVSVLNYKKTASIRTYTQSHH